MENRELGRTGMKVSVIGLGTLGFMRADCSQDDVTPIIRRAEEAGINFIDTAYAYGAGKCDRLVGKAMEENSEHWTILARSHKREPDEFSETMELTFDNLRREVLDIFQFHDITNPGDYEDLKQPGGIYDIARKAKEEGRIRFIGISTHAETEIMRDMIESGRFDVITVSYNVANSQRQPSDGEDLARTARELLPLAAEHGVGITVMKPFGGGVLCRPRTGPDGEEIRLSPEDLLRFCTSNPNVASVTPGIENMEQLETAITAAEAGAVLSEDKKRELEKQAGIWGMDFCRQCGYCLPCEEGIAIPKAMEALEKSEEEEIKKACSKLDPGPDVCTECGKCVERCPYSLPIPEKLKQLM